MTRDPARQFGIEFISVLGQEPARFVALAAKLGCNRIGLAAAPITGPFGSDPPWSLRNDPALVPALKQALAEHDVSVSLGEGFFIMPGRDIADMTADLDLMAELGAERLNACAMEPDPARNRDQFAAFAALAADRGMPVTVEFMPGTPVPDLAAGLKFVEASGAANAGILVDAMHFFCSGGAIETLRAAPADRIAYAQLCDARQASFYEGYFQDARNERLLPGEGALPLADFLAALPAYCPVGVETPSVARAEAGMGHEERLIQALAAARAVSISLP